MREIAARDLCEMVRCISRFRAPRFLPGLLRPVFPFLDAVASSGTRKPNELHVFSLLLPPYGLQEMQLDGGTARLPRWCSPPREGGSSCGGTEERDSFETPVADVTISMWAVTARRDRRRWFIPDSLYPACSECQLGATSSEPTSTPRLGKAGCWNLVRSARPTADQNVAMAVTPRRRIVLAAHRS
jgi:hypothetical protein